MKYIVVILGVLALLAITQAQKSSEQGSSAESPSDPPRPKPIHFGIGFGPAQPVESGNQQEDSENTNENPPERVPVWNVELKFGSKG